VLALFSCLFLLNKLPAQAQNFKSAKEFVQQVYKNYADPDLNRMLGRQVLFYTPDLYHLILADRTAHPGEIGKLDRDPICDCQDPGDRGDLNVQSIKLFASSQTRLKATVAFLITNEPVTVTLSLLDTRPGWRIDDIRSRDMPSLRALLEK
jgi:hypothetical protein